MPKPKLNQALERAKRRALKDCWEYHNGIMETTKEDLYDYLIGVNLEGWEDVGYFIGYIRGLEEAQRLNAKK